MEAVTGHGARQLVADRLDLLDRLGHILNAPINQLETRLEGLLADHRALQKEIERLQREQAKGQLDGLLAQVQRVAGVNLLATQVQVASVDNLREMADWFRDKAGSGVAVMGAVIDSRPQFIATVTEDLVARGIKAGDIIREVSKVVGGGGGGRPNNALLETLPANVLVKRRYKLMNGRFTFSIDQFLGPLEGLVLAEIEQPDLAGLLAIPHPSIARREVTDDWSFTGGELEGR